MQYHPSSLGLVYAILAVINFSMLYPLSGFLADVYGGRFKIIGLTTFSISSVTLAAVFVGRTITRGDVHLPFLVDLQSCPLLCCWI